MGRALTDPINSALSYALIDLRGFFIYLLFGLFYLSPEPVFTQRPVWEIQPKQWDKILLQNSAVYLVEGKGGLGMLLGESEDALIKKWGYPAYRDYATPEKLHYNELTFTGHFILRAGFIEKIVIETPKKSYTSLKWLTALGLHYEDLEGKSKKQVTTKILQTYKQARYTESESRLEIYSRGISFLFRKDFLWAVEIYKPYEVD